MKRLFVFVLVFCTFFSEKLYSQQHDEEKVVYFRVCSQQNKIGFLWVRNKKDSIENYQVFKSTNGFDYDLVKDTVYYYYNDNYISYQYIDKNIKNKFIHYKIVGSNNKKFYIMIDGNNHNILTDLHPKKGKDIDYY